MTVADERHADEAIDVCFFIHFGVRLVFPSAPTFS